MPNGCWAAQNNDELRLERIDQPNDYFYGEPARHLIN
ncbi:hypothetical protein GA0116948_113123 [Chitinophaga costaii]|uniref:Uncharacterized protein n=1 Tax=Chitinophaga costaii TaxID=1335309 RepID=A0A1C4FEN6_9BACT|nr:hypothetical protein GA0116948_113123 [Chitinophaga costaii]